MARIGVFTCCCGENIARSVDVEQVAAKAGSLPGVRCSVSTRYMCSDPGQSLIREKIRKERLNAVVVASCSPHMHLKTFRKAAEREGVNPYLVEMANIREHCSWVHHDRREATAKAIDLVRMAVAKVRHNRALEPIRIPVTRRALVVGGGVAGIQAALDIADGGIEVVLVEREPSIGGRMAGLSETFPTLDCSQCILTPRMVEVAQHPGIRLYSYAEIESVQGYVGNFTVAIRKKARYVDVEKCTGCGQCWNTCPSKKTPSEFDFGLGKRTAIYVPFPQAVPARPVIDRNACLWLTKGKCGACAKKCQAGAIRFDDADETVTEEVGAVVVATGYKLYDIGRREEEARVSGYGEYGYGRYRDVIDSLQFERLASASGPTGGEIRRPSDSAVPKTVVFISCVGSRDNAKGLSYCSKICCMVNAKHAMLFKHKVHDGQAHVFYMDIRAGGKNYDEFVRRAIEQDGAQYHRGRVSKITEENGKLVVRGVDTLAGEPLTIEADLVVLAAAICPAEGAGRAGSEAGRRLRHLWISLGVASEAAAGRDQRRRCVRLRRLPRPQGHSRIGRAGVGRGRQGARHVQPDRADPRAGNRKCQRSELRRLFRLRQCVPVRRRREGRDSRPRRRACQANGEGQRGALHGLRHLRGRLSLKEHRPGRLFGTTGVRHGGEPRMSQSRSDGNDNGWKPKIVAYVCNWCTYLGADLAGTNRLEYPATVRIVRLPCTGRIDFNLIVKALEMGADAVVVSGCHPGDCHYTAGNYHARRRWVLFRELLDTMGIDLDRIHFAWISAAEGKKFQQVITDITEKTRAMGPYRDYREICET